MIKVISLIIAVSLRGSGRFWVGFNCARRPPFSIDCFVDNERTMAASGPHVVRRFPVFCSAAFSLLCCYSTENSTGDPRLLLYWVLLSSKNDAASLETHARQPTQTCHWFAREIQKVQNFIDQKQWFSITCFFDSYYFTWMLIWFTVAVLL